MSCHTIMAYDGAAGGFVGSVPVFLGSSRFASKNAEV